MKYAYTAIALFVPPPYRETIAETSRSCGIRFGSSYVLDEMAFPPHTTMWIANIPESNVEKVATVAEESLEMMPAFNVEMGDIVIEDSGYVSIRVQKTEVVRKLHLQLLTRLDEFREGYVPEKYLKVIEAYPAEQQESIRMYGTRAAGPSFAPHVTVGTVGDQFVSVARRELPYMLRGARHVTFSVGELVYFKQGIPGKSISIIKRFPLT